MQICGITTCYRRNRNRIELVSKPYTKNNILALVWGTRARINKQKNSIEITKDEEGC